MRRTIGLVGGRGYVGEEFLRLLAQHPALELAWASSRSMAGQRINSIFTDLPFEQAFESITPETIATREADVIVLAMPNAISVDYVARMNPAQRVIDLSADHRFDESWTYGLPELNRASIRNATRVSNPGCYATAVQMALVPLSEKLCALPVAFGISGYSGAGRKKPPSPESSAAERTFLPYSLAGHVHEREVSYRLKQDIRFLPHVASFFRGISITVAAQLSKPSTAQELHEHFRAFYAGEPLVRVSAAMPEIPQVVQTAVAALGGFAVDKRDSRRVCLVSCIDNLLKGAASQAMQNVNLMLGLDELSGIGNTSIR